MRRTRRDLLWIPTFAVLVALAVPWPLWGVDRVVAGLPVWIWWHVGWLGLCAVLFRRFASSGAWERGMGIDPDAGGAPTGGDPDAVDDAVPDGGRVEGGDPR